MKGSLGDLAQNNAGDGPQRATTRRMNYLSVAHSCRVSGVSLKSVRFVMLGACIEHKWVSVTGAEAFSTQDIFNAVHKNRKGSNERN